MPSVCIGGHAAGRAAQHTQNRRLIVGLGRLRQEVEIALDEPRDRGATGRRVALRAPNLAQCNLSVSNLSSGRHWELNQVPAV